MQSLDTLRISTPRLVLRLPSQLEWSDLARRIAGRVVPEDQAEFLGSWAHDPPGEFESAFESRRSSNRASWSRESWTLELGVFEHGTLVGMISLIGSSFPSNRELTTASLVERSRRGVGLGTEMRQAALLLAFTCLHARAVRSGAHVDNHASHRVSEKLGYQLVGHEAITHGGRAATFTCLRLAREHWHAPPDVQLHSCDVLRTALHVEETQGPADVVTPERTAS
jgi:RimJ/RimL family protein N-acetyltransferase